MLHHALSICPDVSTVARMVGLAAFAVGISAITCAAVGPVLAGGAGRWPSGRAGRGSGGTFDRAREHVSPVRAAAIQRYQKAEERLGLARTPSEALWSLSACEINRRAAELETRVTRECGGRGERGGRGAGQRLDVMA